MSSTSVDIRNSFQDLTSTNTTIVSSELFFESITDGIATLQNNILIGIEDPVNLSDAVSKEYVDNYMIANPPVLPGGSDKEIQYNDGNGNFKGLTNFTWTTATNTFTSYGTITNSFAEWSGSQIDNIADQILPSDATNKQYVDSLNDIFETEVNLSDNETYIAVQCVVGLIRRIGTPNTTLIDLTPTASEIISYIYSNNGTTPIQVTTLTNGTTTRFSLVNDSDDDTALIILVPNTGIVVPSIGVPGSFQKQLFISIHKGYIVNFKVFIESEDTVYFIIENNNFIKGSQITNTGPITSNEFNIQDSSSYFINNLYSIENFLYRIVPTYITNDEDIIYSAETLLNKLIIRGPNLTSDKTDSFDDASNIADLIPYVYQPVSSSVGFTIYIQNVDLVYNIIINDTTSTGWTSDFLPNNLVTIGPGQTGIFGLSFYNNLAYIYTIGIVDR